VDVVCRHASHGGSRLLHTISAVCGQATILDHLSILAACLRTNSMIARTPSVVWLLERSYVSAVAARRGLPSSKHLAGVSMFSFFGMGQLARVQAVMHHKTYGAGIALVNEGDPIRCLCIVHAGQVSIFWHDVHHMHAE
jgi:hypothetical protein